MFEALGLVFFAAIVYLFLVVIPAAVEYFGSEEFASSYFKHLSQSHLNSFGRWLKRQNYPLFVPIYLKK